MALIRCGGGGGGTPEVKKTFRVYKITANNVSMTVQIYTQVGDEQTYITSYSKYLNDGACVDDEYIYCGTGTYDRWRVASKKSYRIGTTEGEVFPSSATIVNDVLYNVPQNVTVYYEISEKTL